jgi:hypothetical protein
MAKKANWAEVDKRISGRKATWSQEDAKASEADLKKLPDLSDQIETVDLAQPALAAKDEEEEQPPAEDGAAEPSGEAGNQGV